MANCLYCGNPISFECVWSSWFQKSAVACKSCYMSFTSIAIDAYSCKKCSRPYDEKWFTGKGELCIDCKERWQDKELFLGNRSLLSYEKNGQAWMTQFKFRGDTALAEMFKADIQKVWHGYKRYVDAIVPIPLSPSRRKERRFNQAAIIAEMMDNRKLVPLLLKNEQEKQSKLHKYERLHRENPFVLNEDARQNLSGRSILLVDDIYTTGTTIEQAAQKIWGVCACEIYSFTLFRS